MIRGKKRKVLAFAFLALALLVVLFSFSPNQGPRAGDRASTILEGHQLSVQALAFASDGATLTSAAYALRGSGEWEVAVWDVGSARLVTPCTAYTDAVRCLALAPGGRVLAAAGQDRSLWLWEASSANRQRLGEPRAHVQALAFSEDGAQLAVADFGNILTLWDVASGRSRTFSEGVVGPVAALTFAPNGTVLAGSVNDKTIRLWEVATGMESGVLSGHARVAMALAFAPDGRSLASGDLGGSVKLWDVTTLTERANLEANRDNDMVNEVTALAFSPDGQTLAVAIDRDVQLWDVATGALLTKFHGHQAKVACLAFSPDGTRLASGSYDHTVRLWNVARQRP
jgi:WD40 repeat protein